MKSVCVVWDDICHPLSTYRKVVEALFEQDGWALTTTTRIRDVLGMPQAPDLLVVFTVGCPEGEEKLCAEEQKKLQDMVEDGMGALYVHAGLACVQEDTPEYAITCGHFVHHPEPHDPTLVCALPGVEHPILMGTQPFVAADEHYFCKVEVQKVKPFLCSISRAGTEIAGWTQQLGRGRVACITPGHTEEMLDKMQTLLANAAQWCTWQR